MAQPSVKIVKSFIFQGGVKEFSNRYYFDGAAPGSTSTWHDLFDALVLKEKLLFNGGVTITRCIGYDGDNDVPAASKTYTTAGTGSFSGTPLPGECAIVARMATTKTSTKGHPVYVFSYYHHAMKNTGDLTGDIADTGQTAAVDTYLNGWLTGHVVGARTYKRTTPDGHLTTGRLVDQFVGHRDFPR